MPIKSLSILDVTNTLRFWEVKNHEKGKIFEREDSFTIEGEIHISAESKGTSTFSRAYIPGFMVIQKRNCILWEIEYDSEH